MEIQQRAGEVAAKLAQVRALMAQRDLDVVVLTRSPNVAWLTAGASTDIVLTSDRSSITVAVTPDRAMVITNPIEGPRLDQEEHLAALGLTLDVRPWWDASGAVAAFLDGQRGGSDDGQLAQDIGSDLQDMRTTLQPAEIERLRLAAGCGVQAMRETIAQVAPGMTEWEIAARLAERTIAQGGRVVVNLVASDERIAQFRHPLPTDKQVERYAMLVLCCQVGGLIAALSRLVHFGPLPADLEAKALAVAQVDARLIHATREGRTLGDQFATACQAYADAGYSQAIDEHHQGGSIGYLSRERLATPDNPTAIQTFQAFAWNPSLRGVKSEDTIVLTDAGPEIITSWLEWPTWDVSIDGHVIQRPAILVR
jgi:Xaa-Pro aminopeptidase